MKQYDPLLDHLAQVNRDARLRYERQISQLQEWLEAWREWYIATRIGEHERLRNAEKTLRQLGEI